MSSTGSLSLLFFLFFFSSAVLAAPNQEALCLLLNQQVSQFSHVPNSRQYRDAKRAYDRDCRNLPKKKSDPVVTSTTQIEPESIEDKTVTITKDAIENKIEPPTTSINDQNESRAEAEKNHQPSELLNAPSDQTVPEQEQQTQEKQAQLKALYDKEQEKQNSPSVADPSFLEAQAQSAIKAAPVLPREPAQQEPSLFADLLLPTISIIVLLILIAGGLWQLKGRGAAIKAKTADLAAKVNEKSIAVKRDKSKKKRLAKGLDPELYSSFKQLNIVVEGQQTKSIERVIVSAYGLFVIVAPEAKGAIFGGANAAQWSEHNDDKTVPFDNPLQLANQLSHALGRLLDVSEGLKPLVMFHDSVTFKSPMPENVIHRHALIETIKGVKQLEFMDEQVEQFTQILTTLFNEQYHQKDAMPVDEYGFIASAGQSETKELERVNTSATGSEHAPDTQILKQPIKETPVAKQENPQLTEEPAAQHDDKEQDMGECVSPATFIADISSNTAPRQASTGDEINDPTKLTTLPDSDNSDAAHVEESSVNKLEPEITPQPTSSDFTNEFIRTEPSVDETQKQQESLDADEVAQIDAMEQAREAKRVRQHSDHQFKEPVVREYIPEPDEDVDEIKSRQNKPSYQTQEVDNQSPVDLKLNTDKANDSEPEKSDHDETLHQGIATDDIESLTETDTLASSEPHLMDFEPVKIAKGLKPEIRNDPKTLLNPAEEGEKKNLFANLSLDPDWGNTHEFEPTAKTAETQQQEKNNDISSEPPTSEEQAFITQAVAFCPQCLSTVEQSTDDSGAKIFTCSSYPKCDFKRTLR